MNVPQIVEEEASSISYFVLDLIQPQTRGDGETKTYKFIYSIDDSFEETPTPAEDFPDKTLAEIAEDVCFRNKKQEENIELEAEENDYSGIDYFDEFMDITHYLHVLFDSEEEEITEPQYNLLEPEEEIIKAQEEPEQEEPDLEELLAA